MSYRLLAALAATLMLGGCARDMSSDTYTSGAPSGKVLSGTVLSARPVKIKAHDKLQDNTTGGLIGGAGGAVAGSQVGNGNGSIAAGIGGAIIGAVAGAVIEDQLGTSEGMEYLVRIDAKHARKEESKTRKQIKESGKSSVDNDVKMSIDTSSETDMVSVVQKADPDITEGSHVYVVYHDDRPRLVPQHKSQ